MMSPIGDDMRVVCVVFVCVDGVIDTVVPWLGSLAPSCPTKVVSTD